MKKTFEEIVYDTDHTLHYAEVFGVTIEEYHRLYNHFRGDQKRIRQEIIEHSQEYGYYNPPLFLDHRPA